jgi:hypothetical protein
MLNLEMQEQLTQQFSSILPGGRMFIYFHIKFLYLVLKITFFFLEKKVICGSFIDNGSI